MSNDQALLQIGELREAVRQRLTMAELCAKDGLEGRKEGSALRASCPFHTEKSASFLIGGRAPDKAHCFGCGWGGDIFQYWMERHGVGHLEAVNQLASLVNLTPVISGVKWAKPQAKGLTAVTGNRRFEKGEKPALPRMRALHDEEIEALAKLRGLSAAGVAVAARTFKRVGASEWPLYLNKWQNRWMSPCEAHWFRCKMDSAECKPVPRHVSWVVTDEARWVAQFRRLDGEPYTPRGTTEGVAERKPFKSWSVGTATWPLGASEIGGRVAVLLVEGGADMLACYHFLHVWGRLNDVAVVCMLGGSSRIAEVALPFFKGKRVRIIADADEPKEDGMRPGLEAAYRWQEQLRVAGAAVETFDLDGLVRADGQRVKDCNDLALCEAAVWQSWEIREAFCEWKEGFGG